jgi:hypothetical protein
VILTDICTSIEGERLFLQCRQFNPFLPRNDPKIGCIIYLFKMGISCKAYIEEELNPKNYKSRAESLLDKDTCIAGESIEGFSIKPLGSVEIIHTGAHRGRVINTKKYSYAHIEVGLRSLLQKKEEK